MAKESKAVRYVIPLRGIRFVYGLMMFEAKQPLTRKEREAAVQYVIDNRDCLEKAQWVEGVELTALDSIDVAEPRLYENKSFNVADCFSCGDPTDSEDNEA